VSSNLGLGLAEMVSITDEIQRGGIALIIIHVASAAVAVASSHMTASSSALWSRFSPPSNFVNGHVSTTWFIVCI